jgi:hypothetical protein
MTNKDEIVYSLTITAGNLEHLTGVQCVQFIKQLDQVITLTCNEYEVN